MKAEKKNHYAQIKSANSTSINDNIWRVKSLWLQTLTSSNGDAWTDDFKSYSSYLNEHFAVNSSCSTDLKVRGGIWTSFSNPNFPECLGINENGEFTHALGRMSFDVFTSSHLKRSLHGTFNVCGDKDDIDVNDITMPWNIRKLCTDKIRRHK